MNLTCIAAGRKAYVRDSYMEGHADQRTLLSTGIDREMLTEAFLGLVNLETIDIRDFSARRPRDQTRWSSWGATTVQAETGRPLNFTNYGSYSQSQFLSHIFSTIVYALGKADRTLPRFEVLLRQHPAGLPDTSFHIPEFMFPACKPILENLTALFLTLDLSGAPQHSYDRGFRGVVVNQPGQSLRRFLSYTRNLTHLRLNFRKHDHGLNETFIQWLAEPAASTLGGSNSSLKFSPCTLEPEPIDFPSLKELDLGNFRVDDVSLTALISKFSSRLEGLSLFRIGLFPRSATQSIYTTPDTRRNLWFDFFTALKSTQQAKLSHLKIMACNQEYGGVSQFICQDGTSRINGPREFSGKELKAFFNDLESYMPKDWPQARQMDSDNSSDDDDVSEYNEDEDEDEENEDEDDNDDE